MGVTVLYSSGDNGVAGYNNVCIEVPGTNGGFSPSFPGTCPYVTAVGATQINNGSKVSLVGYSPSPREELQQTLSPPSYF